ncbi:MAG TPA: glycosyltransferase [Vicinamibacterales bacterium]|nr:glycosyltransferase [Vicinamibacterales bacterium]
MKPGVHQVLASLGYGDAIGNEVLGIQRALAAAGYASDIIVESSDPRLQHLTVDYRDAAGDLGEDDLLIHHFSIGSRASRTAFALPCRMMLVYHNITPPEYFLGVHPWLARQCFHGGRELLAYRNRVEIAAGASPFNKRELDALGFPVTAVLPVVPDFSHLAGAPDGRVYDAYDDERANVLFVGRLIPNKRPDQIIRAFHAYQRLFNPDARLILAGSYAQFEGYLAQLHALIAALGVRDVHILGQVTNEELTALYDVADLFLCASEHEGFCVPLVEAFYKRVPVLAYASTAVPETMDGGGLLFETRDPMDIASLMEAVISDEILESRVLAAQDAALDRMRSRDFSATLLDLVRRSLANPRRGTASVAADFWAQYKLAEELDAIRDSRPSAFHALPAEQRRVADVGSRA